MASPKHEQGKMNLCQRKHLRHILNITWPATISNTALYKRCNCIPLCEQVGKARWTMLRTKTWHRVSPPNLALHFALTQANNFRGHVGWPGTNLLDIIRADLESQKMKLNNTDDLINLRKKWPEHVNLIDSLIKIIIIIIIIIKICSTHISTLLGAQGAETKKQNKKAWIQTIYSDSKNKIMYRDTCTILLQIYIIFWKIVT